MPALGTWGHLELRERVGGGTFGQVYRAFDPRLEREVALKLLENVNGGARPATRVVEEGRLLAKLRHPNVVTVHGAEVHDGRVGIWMEYIRGRSLEQLLRERGAFGAREAALIGVELCRALAAVHQAGVIHRDVKADNAMREEGGRILLADLGSGVELRPAEEAQRTLSGTPFYMAPELFRGEPADSRSDLYSLGVLLFRLVTASFPIEARSWSELRDRHARRAARLLRDVRADLPAAFVQVVERATAWEPAARFATAGQMEQALSIALGVEGAGADAGGASRPAARPSRSRGVRWSWLGAAVLLAVVVAVAWPRLGRRESDSPSAAGATASRVPHGPSAGAYSVEAALYRIPAGTTKRERVDSGARLALDDRLLLEFKASTDLHVYVINEDEAGHAWALFPIPGLEPRNPLPAGTTHVLPGTLDGTPQSWTVYTSGGRERVLVLASPTRQLEFEAEMSRLQRPGQLAVHLSPVARLRLRGIGGLSELPPGEASATAEPLFDMAERLASGAERVQGVWVRQLEFENPPAE
jgi:serine/threonine-protein kinase